MKPSRHRLLRRGSSLASALVFLAAAAAAAAAASPPGDARNLPPNALALLNRVTWGANQADGAAVRSMGAGRWLERQLHPPPGDRLPPAAQAQIDACRSRSEPMAQLVAEMDAQNKAAANASPIPTRRRPRRPRTSRR